MKNIIENLEKETLEIRKKIAYISYKTGRGYLSTAYSTIEILLALYCSGIINYDKNNAENFKRDRVILSKGHAGLALYMVLSKIGLIEENELLNFSGIDCEYGLHPISDLRHGIEMTSGSLGHGLSFAIGHAYAAKLNNQDYKVYVILGDGEMQEGSNWEALMLASALSLDNLIVIVDRNNRQITGKVEDIVPLGDLSKKLVAFGFDVGECDGHSINELISQLNRKTEKPKAIVANTIKGKGLSFVEDKDGWHGRSLNEQEWILAKKELGIEK